MNNKYEVLLQLIIIADPTSTGTEVKSRIKVTMQLFSFNKQVNEFLVKCNNYIQRHIITW